jgi:hypothetical protein
VLQLICFDAGWQGWVNVVCLFAWRVLCGQELGLGDSVCLWGTSRDGDWWMRGRVGGGWGGLTGVCWGFLKRRSNNETPVCLCNEVCVCVSAHSGPTLPSQVTE